MLYGARQVGKTYILKKFGENEYKNLIYINCYKNRSVETLFAEDKNIERILLGLSALSGQKIDKDETLIFLDEVQEIPSVVAALKYFAEDAPDVHIAVAGSLLGVLNMHDESFPVGKVNILHLYPMTFCEFLDALGEGKKVELLLKKEDYPVVNSLSNAYIELLRQYYFVGGMPEAVMEFIETRTPDRVRKIQKDILLSYQADIAKHTKGETQRIREVFQSIPSQLAKENKKFIFGAIKKGSRAANFEVAIQWLVDAGLVYKVQRVTKVAIPMSLYKENDAFKLFMLDTGLLGAMMDTPPALMLIGNNVFSEFKGAFTENYVLTQIIADTRNSVSYYSKENSSMEIDFLIQAGAVIVPIEVKAEENVKSKSLKQFITVDNASTGLHGVRFSMKGFEHQSWMTNVPLFAVEIFVKDIIKQNTITKI